MSQNEIINKFKTLDAGSSFMSMKSHEFSEKYPKKFVAVLGEQLVAVDEDFDRIMGKIQETKLNPSFVLIEYMPGKGEIVLY